MPTPPHVQESLIAMLAAEPSYTLAGDYFEGRVQEVFSSRKLRQLLGPTGYRYRVNFARTPVDVLLERTTMNAIEGSDAGAVDLLTQVWDANELGLEAKDLHRRVYEYGDAYILAWPSDELAGGVEAYCHDPHNVRVFYDVQRPRVKSHAVHTWVEKGGEANGLGPGLWQRVNIYFPEYVEQWVTSQRIDVEGRVTTDVRLTERVFVPYSSEDGEGVVDNPTPGIIPVFHFRNGRPYGRPEHTDAYGPQDMINKLNITMMSSVDFAGFPQRYVLTDSSLEPTSEDAFGMPEDPRIENELPGLDADSDLQAGPGETWVLSGAKLSVGQFQVADTSNFLDASSAMIRQMASVCDIPAYYFDSSGQMPSGESFRRAEAPLNKKLDDRLALLGVTWNEFFDYCLAVNNRPASDSHIAWQPPEVYSDSESWETAKAQQEAGVDKVQTLIERGYSQEQAEQWVAANKPVTPTVPAVDSTPPVETGLA